MTSLTTGILHNLYSKSEYAGRRSRVARRLRDIQGDINNARHDANVEKWRRRNDACDDIEETFSIPDVQGTLIFVVTETMCSSLEEGLMCGETRDLGMTTYIMLGNPLLARMYDA